MKNKTIKKEGIIDLKIIKSSNRKITTVRQLKRKYDNLPLNFLFGIDDEIDYQCPIIDEYIEKIESCRESLLKAKRARTLESKNTHLLKAIYSIENIDIVLDTTTRDNFVKLRKYANQWKSFSIKLLNASKTPEKFMIK